MRIFLIGSKGQLGCELTNYFNNVNNFNILALDLPDVDITNKENLEKIIFDFKPDLIINSAAYTNVEKAEIEKDLAFLVNKEGVKNLAQICLKKNICLVHISTDFVFNGDKINNKINNLENNLYKETDLPNALSVYGQSKLEGEQEILSVLNAHYLIIRTSWLYGFYGHNFVKTMLKLFQEKEIIQVVNDQYGCPTCAKDLAEAILAICQKIKNNINQVKWGVYNYSGSGITNWYEFAKEILKIAQENKRFQELCKVKDIKPVITSQYKTLAKRPNFSALDCSLINQNFGVKTKFWKESLSQTIKQILDNNGF